MSRSVFDGPFEALKHRVLMIGNMTGAGWGCTAAAVILLGAVGVDLVWELPTAGRILALVSGLIAAVILLVLWSRAARRKTAGVLLARRLDETGVTGGEIMVGYDLQSLPGQIAPQGDAVQAGLAELAVTRATRLVESIPLEKAAPNRPFRYPAYCLAALCLVVVGVTIAVPRLAATEWLRFFDPFGDHPPFSYTHLAVEPGDIEVRYGAGLDVTVEISGPPVEELDLILRFDLDQQGSYREEILPLFSEGVGKWRAAVAAVTAPGVYYVKAPVTRSRRFRISCLTIPDLTEVTFRITPPAYTGVAAYEGPLPPQGITGLAGTRVDVRARSNRPLSLGTLELTGDDRTERVTLSPAADDGTAHEVQGSFTLEYSGRFELHVTDVAGQESHDSLTGQLTVVPDEAPVVRMIEPIAKSLATPTTELPIVVAAEDDYGVAGVQLYRSINDEPLEPIEFTTAAPPERREEVPLKVPLEQLGLKPGDILKLFARAVDNDPAGAKGTDSEVAVVQIITEEELEQLIRTREGLESLLSKYQEAQRRLEALQEEAEQLRKQIEKRDPSGELSAEERAEMERFSQRIAEEAEAIAKSAEKVLPYDIDQALNEELERLVKRMQETADELQAAAGQPALEAGAASRALAQAQDNLAGEKQELQTDINEPLDKLASLYPLFEDEARFGDLARQQREIADHLASLRNEKQAADPATKARMRELEDAQKENREALEQLLNEIESHAARLPEDDPQSQELAASAREFAQSVKQSEACPQMSAAEQGLQKFSGNEGHSAAKDASETMDSFLSQCEGMGQQAGQACQNLKFKPGRGAAGETLSQMLADSGRKRSQQPGQNAGKSSGTGRMGPGGESGNTPSSLENVGLYGKTPARGNPQPSRHKGRDGAPTIGGSYRADEGPQAASRLDPHGMLRASGTSPAAVPAKYRGRVERYFQRIADEAGSK
ncbi:MAG: hypothetical protein JSS02_14570 [Planctomycetes bacterium]|nr:hypothetical protein [Planctomycetota bacterium]